MEALRSSAFGSVRAQELLCRWRVVGVQELLCRWGLVRTEELLCRWGPVRAREIEETALPLPFAS